MALISQLITGEGQHLVWFGVFPRPLVPAPACHCRDAPCRGRHQAACLASVVPVWNRLPPDEVWANYNNSLT